MATDTKIVTNDSKILYYRADEINEGRVFK